MPAGGTRIPRAGARPAQSPDLSALLSEAGRIGAQPVPEAPASVVPDYGENRCSARRCREQAGPSGECATHATERAARLAEVRRMNAEADARISERKASGEIPAPPPVVAPAPPLLPEQSEAAALRAQLSAMADQLRAAEARAAEAIRARADTSRGPTVEVGTSGAIVLKGFKQSRPWYAWPSQIDALAEGVDVASLPASHVLRRMVEAAAGLPRRKEGGAK